MKTWGQKLSFIFYESTKLMCYKAVIYQMLKAVVHKEMLFALPAFYL